MKVKLHNVGVIKSCDVEFVPGINLIIGSSGSGKSTLMRSIFNIAANEFNDSDISFGKNTMEITVENNGNIIEYSRSLKAKGERCYYTVNGESYVKLGRQPLQAVTDVLKIGDLDINGEKINFNFNLQFSTPFLILGSQSTLYNVLTYRSNFDISSINDYYIADIKNNANDIATNAKLKERLDENLKQIQSQAEVLSPIEQIYSNYALCKHKAETINDLGMLRNKMSDISYVLENLESLTSVYNHISKALELIELVNEITEHRDIKAECDKLENLIEYYNGQITHHNNAIDCVQNIVAFDEILSAMNQLCTVNKSLSIINDCLHRCNVELKNEVFATDAVKQHVLLKLLEKYKSITDVLSKDMNSEIVFIDDLIVVDDKLNSLLDVNDAMKDVLHKLKITTNRISKFEICPLCGSTLKHALCI